MKNKNGFTMSEVLITLGVIGVVAAMTIPSLIAKQQERTTVVKVKKAYSNLSNAFQLARIENGDNFIDGISNDITGKRELMNLIKPYFNVYADCRLEPGKCKMKPICGDTQNIKAGASIYCAYIKKSGTGYMGDHNCARIFLKNGTIIYITDIPNKNPTIAVDINGPAEPNTFGRDMFFFTYNSQQRKVLPFYSGLCSCKKEDSSAYEQSRNCAKWILEKDNMNYLH